MKRIFGLLAAIIFLTTATPSQAQTIVIAVEDKDFAPYTMVRDGKAAGACAEFVEGTLDVMGAKAEYVSVPWSRVLLYVENQKVDAALCGTISDDRAAYSHFPEEAVLYYDATLFVRSDSDVQTFRAEDLSGLTFGTIIGYSYQGGAVELEQHGLIRKQAYDRLSLMRQLLNGQVDMVLDSLEPMQRQIDKLGATGQIRVLDPKVRFAPAYLFFSQKPGNEKLAQDFTEALRAFKETPAYWEIQSKYDF